MPKLAQEAHGRAMHSTVQAALQQAGISEEQLEGVAVTIGPGLSLCLQVCVRLGAYSDMRTSSHAVRVTDACHAWSAAGASQQSATAALVPYVCSKTQHESLRNEFRRAMCRFCPLLIQVGVHQARQIAGRHGLKYIPVHHMEAHALIARAGTAVAFPFLCLLVSGGHNMLVVVEGVGSYTLLGSTLDDAVGRDLVSCHQSATHS